MTISMSIPDRSTVERTSNILQAAALGAAAYRPHRSPGRAALVYPDGREVDLTLRSELLSLRVFAGGHPVYWLELPAAACPHTIHRACQRALVETTKHHPIK